MGDNPYQGQNLQALLGFLMKRASESDPGNIQPTNYPGVPTDALTGAYLKNVPGALSGDVENSGYGLGNLSGTLGKFDANALTQLAQLLTAHIRGQRGEQTPGILEQFQQVVGK